MWFYRIFFSSRVLFLRTFELVFKIYINISGPRLSIVLIKKILYDIFYIYIKMNIIFYFFLLHETEVLQTLFWLSDVHENENKFV